MKCPRSDRGARFAVDAALAALLELEDQPPSLSQLDALPGQILQRWLESVASDAAIDPPEVESGSTPRLYGSTLAAAIVTPTWTVALQIGDGDIVFLKDTNTTRPVPHDDRLLGNETTSLSLKEAEKDVRLAAHFGPPPTLIMLATDGYKNSFQSDAGFLSAPRDLLNALVEDGPTSVAEALPDWLKETSEEGSGDDISVGLIWTP